MFRILTSVPMVALVAALANNLSCSRQASPANLAPAAQTDDDQVRHNKGGTQPMASGAIRIVGNTPEPFLTKTSITLEVRHATESTMTIIDPTGRTIRTLTHGALPAGITSVTWDGRDDRGGFARPGRYGVRIEADGLAHIALITMRLANE